MTDNPVLVFGESGQLAQSLAECTAKRGIPAVFLGRARYDLSSPAPLARLALPERPAFIINAAAYTSVDQAETDRDACLAVNATAAAHLADLAANLAVPLVHISTDYVFDGSSPRPYRESDATAPLGVYGTSKLAGEHAIAARHADHAILRTAWLFSPFGRNFVKTILAKGLAQPELRIVDDQVGSPTSALDLADAALTIGNRLVQFPTRPELRGIIHVVNRGEASWAGLARQIGLALASHNRPFARITGIPSKDYPTPARRPANSRLDTQRLAERHGIILPDWRDAVAISVARLMERP
ncbi:RfbD dTDP-4-dehydrorhamnose reductase [Rhabdaerophilaceae bacterium]